MKSRPGIGVPNDARVALLSAKGTNLYFILVHEAHRPRRILRVPRRHHRQDRRIGGSTSHHHGGTSFAPWLEDVFGRTEMDVLRALKAHFDPDGITNPGGNAWPRSAREPAMSADLIVDRRGHPVDTRAAWSTSMRDPPPGEDADRAVLRRAARLRRAASGVLLGMFCPPRGNARNPGFLGTDPGGDGHDQRVTMINVDRERRTPVPAIVWLDQRKADIHKVLRGSPCRCSRRRGSIRWSSTPRSTAGRTGSSRTSLTSWERTHKFLFLSGLPDASADRAVRGLAGNAIGTVPFDVKSPDWAGSTPRRMGFRWSGEVADWYA